MRKNSHGKILREKPKEQYLSTVPKSCLCRHNPSFLFFSFFLFLKGRHNLIENYRENHLVQIFI